ncbi:MAG: hypothetical protein ACE14V_12865 [bacterium]
MFNRKRICLCSGVVVLGLIVSIFAQDGKINMQDCQYYVVPPITSNKILPTDISIPDKANQSIIMTACPGEYEPASFVLVSHSGITAVQLKVSNLVGTKESIPAENIDIKLVKCWYQAGSAWVNINQDKWHKVLVPELLLNDTRLVKVDYEHQENYLRLSFPEGDKYVWISDTTDKGGIKKYSLQEFPVKDSPELLPFDIPIASSQQIWVTIEVPENTQPGTYTGKIDIAASGTIIRSIPLTLKIFPIELALPNYSSSIYYRGKLDPKGEGSISSEWKSKEQFQKELADLYQHGVTNPMVYQPFDEKMLGEVLSLRNAVGMKNQPLYYLGLGFSDTALSSIPDQVKPVIDLAKQYGVPEVYFYGIDEAIGDRLKSQRATWEKIHQAGGKVFVAGYKNSNFELIGDMQDLLVCARYPTQEEAAKWHSVGHKIWCYANPQGGVENPEVNRRNYGLLIWKSNYDGAATYAYQHGFGDIWNDFDHPAYREHNYTYPTVDGIIDTIGWEGYREGVDDVRYLTTLLQAIDRNKNSSSAKKRQIAKQAEQYLAMLDVKRDLDTIRLEIVSYIFQLSDKYALGREKAVFVPLSIEPEQLRSYPCYRLKHLPVIDGRIQDDPAWQTVPIASEFLLLEHELKLAPKQTTVRMGYTATDLYLGIICLEPEMDKLKSVLPDKDNLWREDSSEIFMLPKGSKAYNHFAVNAIGSRWNNKLTGDNKVTWQAKAFKGDQFWSIELKIPFTAFGIYPKNNEVWRCNICRNIYTSGERYSSWANLETEFHIPEKFAHIVFCEKTLSPAEASRISVEISTQLLRNTIVNNLKMISHTVKIPKSSAIKNKILQEKIARLNKESEKIKKQLSHYEQFPVTEQNQLIAISYRLVQENERIEKEILLDLF